MLYRPPKAKVGSFLWIFSLSMVVLMGFVSWIAIRTAWGAATMVYEVTPSHVVITFGPDVIEIPRNELIGVQVIEEPTRGRRIVGTSMPGLKEGSWSFAETGRITLYATTTHPLTVLETPERKWGISPDDPSAFVDAVNSGDARVFDPVAASSSSGIVAILVLSGLSVLLVVGVVIHMRRVAGTIGYELGPDDLLIHGSFRPIRIPYKSISSVSIEEPTGVPFRTMGIGLPGLHWGSFSWKALGPNLRIYATRLKPLVVVRAGSRTIGITPEDDQGFVEALKRMVPGIK